MSFSGVVDILRYESGLGEVKMYRERDKRNRKKTWRNASQKLTYRNWKRLSYQALYARNILPVDAGTPKMQI
jgi:hypothetical protein